MSHQSTFRMENTPGLVRVQDTTATKLQAFFDEHGIKFSTRANRLEVSVSRPDT